VGVDFGGDFVAPFMQGKLTLKKGKREKMRKEKQKKEN